MADAARPQARGGEALARRMVRAGPPLEYLDGADAYWVWVQHHRPPVDALYAFLFLVGYYAIFIHRPPDLALYGCQPRRLALGEPASTAVPAPRFLWFLRALLVALHGVPLGAYLAKRVLENPRWHRAYVRRFRENVFVAIRVLPIMTAFLSGNVGKCQEGSEAGCPCPPPHLSWMCTFVLYTCSYQVAKRWQVGLQFVSAVCLSMMPSYRWDMVERTKLFVCVWAVPSICACFLEKWVIKEHQERARRRKLDPAYRDQPGASESPRARARTVKAGPSKEGADDPLKVDISGVLGSVLRTERTGTFLNYTPMVTVQTKMIKVRNEGEVTDEQMVRMARTFSNNHASRLRRGRCTVVKAVAMRGCLLFVAEVLEPLDGQCAEVCCHANKQDSKDLLKCLPKELHHEPMDVVMGDMRATYADGKLVTFDAQNRTGQDLEVPEVLLLKPPCVREGTESDKGLEVFMSEVKGDWDSLKLVMVYKDSVKKQVDVPRGNKTRLEFASEEGVGAGYLHTIGVEGDLGTFIGGLAPFLILPETAAAELNLAFHNTVKCLWDRTSAFKSVGHSQFSAPDCIPEEVESKAWSQFFKPFALDMHFLLTPDAEELFEIMQKEGPERDNYLEVFLHVASFLEGSSAVGTEQYLLKRFKDAGVELTNQGTQVSTGNIFPKVPESYSFTLIRGFIDPNVESKYRYQFSRRLVLMDLAGMVMGLCLLPVVSIIGEAGKCSYMCPLVMHLRLSLICWVVSQSTYITNREPIVTLSWLVRTVAWLGWVIKAKDVVGAPLHPWTTFVFLVWTVLVKTVVLKVGTAFVCTGQLCPKAYE
eukprot:evm.model.scf_75.13 EVM.evm.TU.scf_75.13   scf_75:87091-91768(+)